MISASKEFKEKLKKGANVVNYADITLSNGTVLHLEPKDFMIGGCVVEDKATDGKFGVGYVIGKTLTLRIANHDERFSRYDFYKSIIRLYVALALDNGTVEKIRKGTYYTLVPETPGDTIEISAVDGMYRLDRDYSSSTLIYPATLQAIITQACLYCGIPIGFTQFDNMSYAAQEKPENATYRQVVSYAAQIAGYNARIDNDGYMQLVWYDTALLDYPRYDGGNFITYPHDTTLDGGNFSNYGQGTVIDGGSFTDALPEHIYNAKTMTVSTDDVQITGVKVTGNDDEASASFGESGYVIEVKNPLASQKEQEVANYLGQRIVGMVFRPFSAEVLGNPLYEPFDVVRVSDRKGNTYPSILNSVSYKAGGYTQVACEAEDPVRNGTTYFSEAAQAVAEARRNTTKQIADYDKAVQSMNELAANAMGLFREREPQPNGSYIYYESDEPITVDEDGKCHFEEGSHVWMRSDAGFFSSDDGGKTYTAGYDKNNNAVINILYAIGIVADWIRTGRLEITKSGKTMVLMDFDTGQVILRPDVFELSSGKTIEDIADEAANGAAKKAVNAQTQTDILNKLTNNGTDNGIYLQNGKLYISFSAARGGELTLGGANNVNGSMRVLNSSGVQVGKWDNSGAEIEGKFRNKSGLEWIKIDESIISGGYGSDYSGMDGLLDLSAQYGSNTRNVVLEAKTRDLILNSKGGIFLDKSTKITGDLSVSAAATVTGGLNVGGAATMSGGVTTHYVGISNNDLSMSIPSGKEIKFMVGNTQKGHFNNNGLALNSTLTLNNVGRLSGLRFLGLSAGSGVVYAAADSSKRYKDVLKEMTHEDAKLIYGITPVWARYKSGYLSEDDERNGVGFPMLIAEDVDAHLPYAADHNLDGTVENWNHRVIIPYMIQALKEQKKDIDELKSMISNQ